MPSNKLPDLIDVYFAEIYYDHQPDITYRVLACVETEDGRAVKGAKKYIPVTHKAIQDATNALEKGIELLKPFQDIDFLGARALDLHAHALETIKALQEHDRPNDVQKALDAWNAIHTTDILNTSWETYENTYFNRWPENLRRLRDLCAPISTEQNNPASLSTDSSPVDAHPAIVNQHDAPADAPAGGSPLFRPVILESPYAGDVPANMSYAHDCIRDSLSRGESPYASHIMLTTALDDTDPVQRHTGIHAGFAWAGMAAAVVIYTDRGISPGMRAAIRHHEEHGRRIEYRKLEG